MANAGTFDRLNLKPFDALPIFKNLPNRLYLDLCCRPVASNTLTSHLKNSV